MSDFSSDSFFLLPAPVTFAEESLKHVAPSGLWLVTQGGQLLESAFSLFAYSLTNLPQIECITTTFLLVYSKGSGLSPLPLTIETLKENRALPEYFMRRAVFFGPIVLFGSRHPLAFRRN